MVIGDYLPADKKEEFIRSRLVPGAVIYRHCDFTTPPKIKYLVIANVRSETAVLVINSEIHPFVKSNQHLLDCQVQIDKAAHGFLDHGSFIDCKEVHYIDTADLVAELLDDLDGLKGALSEATRADVIKAVGQSYTMSQGEVDMLVASLS